MAHPAHPVSADDPTGPPEQPGPQEGRCGAIRKRAADGAPIRWCRKYPRRGQARCEDCGGSSPQALAAAERRQQQRRAERAALTLGQPVTIDPVDACLDALYRAHGMVVYIEQQLRDLVPADVVWGRTKETVAEIRSGQWPGTDTTVENAAAVHLWADLYATWLSQQLKAGAECIRAKIGQAIQDRLMELAGEFTTRLDRVVRGLGHDPADPVVLRLVGEVMRERPELEAGAA